MNAVLEQIIATFLIILSAATLGSMIGVGGGFIIVPLLNLVVMLPIKQAVATSLLSIIATSISATTVYVRKKLVDFKLGLCLEISSIIGVMLGANLLYILSELFIAFLLSIVLVYAGIRMFITKTEKNVGDGGYKGNTYRYEFKYHNLLFGVIGSFFAGMASGLLGIGGGIIKLPILVLILSVPMHVAIGTSLFMISITSTTGSIIHIVRGLVNYELGIVAMAGGLIGAQIGSRIGLKIKAIWLRKIFGIILIIFAISVVLKNI